MGKNDYTKRQLALALKELIKTLPLKKITVQNIVDHCGLNRGTFYYHFYDRQELINWIYHSDITEPTRKILQGAPEQWSEISQFGLNIMLRDKELYLQAMKAEGQNNLSSYMRTEIVQNWNLLVSRYMDFFHSEFKDANLSFFAEFMANGAWAMLMKWVNTNMQESPAVLADLIDTIAGYSMEAVAIRSCQNVSV